MRLFTGSVSKAFCEVIFVLTMVDDPDAYHGAPVAVQIIGRRLTEERVMAIAEEVGRLLGLEVNP